MGMEAVVALHSLKEAIRGGAHSAGAGGRVAITTAIASIGPYGWAAFGSRSAACRGGRLAGPELIRYRQRSSAATWIRLPQVSFTMAMVEPVTLVGGMVNSAPAAFIRSYSRCTSST